jgi:hypothetical protein
MFVGINFLAERRLRSKTESFRRLKAEPPVPNDWVSHEYSLEDAEQAFGSFDRRETEKAVFVWN